MSEELDKLDKAEFKNKVAFQIAFLVHSGKPEEAVIDSIVKLAERYSEPSKSRLQSENSALRKLIDEWTQWEADIIADDKAWPKNEMTINGEHYEKMLELQIKRNNALKPIQ